MKTYCLVIDDDNQEKYFKSEVQDVLCKDHIDLVPMFVNPKDRKYMTANHLGFDKNLIVQDCMNIIRDTNTSIVISDYNIATENDKFNGLDILNSINEKRPDLYKILYSGAQIKEAIKKLGQSLIKEISPNTQIVETIKSRIYDMVNTKKYAEKVIKYFRTSPIILQQQLLYNLKVVYKDMKFQSCYSPFKGKTLQEIGEEIEKRTPLGGEFQQALIEQTIAYLIDINKD